MTHIPDEDKNSGGLSLRAIVMEIRADVKSLFALFNHLDDQVIKKTEFELWRESRRTTMRWAIGTVISVASLMVAAVWIIIGTR